MSGDILEALTQGALDLIDEGVKSTPSFGLSAMYRAWQKNRIQEAQEILIAELKSGTRLAGDVDQDSFFGLLFRYLNATKQGAARRNLKLMAEIIRSGCFDVQIPFQPDKIASNAELVSQLTREELLLLATLHHHKLALQNSGVTEDELDRSVHEATLKDLVPKYFDSEDHCEAVAVSLGRTGLVTTPAVWDGNRIQATPRLEELCRLCDLESALSM